MNDSRAALEEAAEAKIAQLVLEIRNLAHRGWEDRPNAELLFREISKRAQKIGELSEAGSSSLKLLLRAIFSGRAHFWKHPTRQLDIYGGGAGYTNFPVELDSSGIPVITEEILKALEAAK